MDALFLKLVNMSLPASLIVFTIFILRYVSLGWFFKNIPRWTRCALWGFVAVRLVCPFSIESPFGISSYEVIPSTIGMSANPEIDTGFTFINDSINPIIADVFTPTPVQSANSLQIFLAVATIVWLVGMAVMLAYAVVSSVRLRVKLRERVLLHDNIYICDHIHVPFVFGVLRPRIYLPSSLCQDDAEYVIAHERAHLKRGDHIWKALAFGILAVYWFNPFMWLAYVLLCRDIEFACDERVVRKLGEACRQSYANALINCSGRHRSLTYPLAFGEISVKGRVKNVLNYKKPAVATVVVAVLVLVLCGVYWLTDKPADTYVFSSIRAAFDERNISYTAYTDVESSPRFLGGKVRTLETSDDMTVVLYTYASPEEAADDAKCVSEDGNSVTVPDGEMSRVSMIGWTSEVRWYLMWDTVVCYVGTDSAVITALGELCGAPFAGVR